MNHVVRAAVAGTAALALALTGCSRPPATAATVEGIRVSDAAAREAASALVAATGTDGQTALRQATFDLLMGEASGIIASRGGVSVSDGDLAGVLGQSPTLAAIADSPEGDDWADSVARTYIVLDRLGQEQFVEELRTLDIEVNPRFGRWDPVQFTLADSSLARVAPGTAG